jgi:hypothetical protein
MRNSTIKKSKNVYRNQQFYYLVCLLLLLIFTPLTSTGQDSAENTNPEKAIISFRIGPGQSLSAERSKELFDLLDKYKGVTDEISFFSHATHAPLPLDNARQRIMILKERMAEARTRGYKSGINLLTTIGHHIENLDHSLKGNHTPMTDIDGNVSMGSFCPNDENMRTYIRALYTITVGANPDFIWIDDDVRLAGHKPVYLTCFCDNCLRIFGKETGIFYTRESIRKILNEGTRDERLILWELWLQHNRNTMANLLGLIEETVHGVNPGLPLGFMTGDRFYEGYDFLNWAKILAGPNQISVMWRPGGGYYKDVVTTDLVGKSHDIGRQVSLLPKNVVSIQSEIENFPYQRLKKAANMVVLEVNSHIAAGSMGAAFNILSMYDEPLDEFEPLIKALNQARPFFDLMVRTLGRTDLDGIANFWNKNTFAAVNLDRGISSKWSATITTETDIYDIGLPASYDAGKAQVVTLSKDNLYALKREEIEQFLAKGLYIDAETLGQLNEMGYAELTGFKVASADEVDRIEKFSDHPLNGGFAGRERDNRQSFYRSSAYTLHKTNEKAQVLSGLIDYTGQKISECTMGTFENRLGGRICIAGYYPWTFLENLSKSAQMKSVFRWLSRDKLPGYIASFHRVNLWIRKPKNGKIALAFTNSSFNAAENIELMLCTENKAIYLYDMMCKQTVVRSSGSDGPYQRFIISSVDPWQIRLVEEK